MQNRIHYMVYYVRVQPRERLPLLEWPYPKNNTDSENENKRVDIYFEEENYKFWVEIGMFGSGEEEKYKKDFNRLANVINQSDENIGVLIHFEIYERGEVIKIFDCLKSKHKEEYDIDIKKFPPDSVSNGKRAWAYRLAFCKKKNA